MNKQFNTAFIVEEESSPEYYFKPVMQSLEFALANSMQTLHQGAYKVTVTLERIGDAACAQVQVQAEAQQMAACFS